MAARLKTMWFLAFFASLSTACADDWYVDNIAGSDKQLGGMTGQPLKTIQQALLRAKPGDRIILKKTGEPYREQLSLIGPQNSGFRGRPFEIVGNGATLEGAEPIRGSDWEILGNNLFQYRPKRLSHQMLYLDDRPMEKGFVVGGDLNQLKPLQWMQRDGWIVFRSEPGRGPYQYHLSCCARSVGITFYEAHDVLVTGLTVQGFQLDGLNVHDRAEQIAIENCVLRGNGRSGLSVGGAADATIASSLIGDNGRAQIRTEGFCRLLVDSCDIIEQAGRIPIENDGGKVVRDGISIRP